MRGQAGFFDIDGRLKEISAKGDDLKRLNAIVDFEAFRPDLARAVPRSDGSKGGRPPFDHVLMWRVLILQASHSLWTSEPSSIVCLRNDDDIASGVFGVGRPIYKLALELHCFGGKVGLS